MPLASKRKFWGIQWVSTVLDDLALKNMPVPTVYFPASNRHYCLYPEPNGMNDSRVADIGKASGRSTLSKEINGSRFGRSAARVQLSRQESCRAIEMGVFLSQTGK